MTREIIVKDYEQSFLALQELSTSKSFSVVKEEAKLSNVNQQKAKLADLVKKHPFIVETFTQVQSGSNGLISIHNGLFLGQLKASGKLKLVKNDQFVNHVPGQRLTLDFLLSDIYMIGGVIFHKGKAASNHPGFVYYFNEKIYCGSRLRVARINDDCFILQVDESMSYLFLSIFNYCFEQLTEMNSEIENKVIGFPLMAFNFVKESRVLKDVEWNHESLNNGRLLSEFVNYKIARNKGGVLVATYLEKPVSGKIFKLYSFPENKTTCNSKTANVGNAGNRQPVAVVIHNTADNAQSSENN